MLSFLAMHGQMLTRSVLAWNLTNDEMSLAYINAAYALPMIFFSVIGGALSDRMSRYKLIQYAQLLLVTNEAIIWTLLFTGNLEFWHLLFAGVLAGIGLPLYIPARTAIVFNVIGQKTLANGTGLVASSMNVSRVLGPMLTGFIVSRWTATEAYLVASLLLLIGYLTMLPVRAGVHESKTGKGFSLKDSSEIFHEIKQGLNYISTHATALVCLIFGFAIMVVAMPLQNILVLFADGIYQVGEDGLGVMMAVAGLGGVIGSFWVASRSHKDARSNLMIANGLGFGLFLCVFSLTSSFYFSLIPLMLANICASACSTLANTTVQLLVNDEQRGRVSSFILLSFGFTPLGVFPLTLSAKLIGIDLTIAFTALLLILFLCSLYIISNAFKALDDAVRRAKKAEIAANSHEAMDRSN